jgi:anti-sigma B factor antagonist
MLRQLERTSHTEPLTEGAFVLRRESDDDVHLLKLYGELDLASADTLDAELQRIEALDPRWILVDLSGLEFIDSTGIRALVRAYHRQPENSSPRLGLCRPAGQVKRVLELAGIREFVTVLD